MLTNSHQERPNEIRKQASEVRYEQTAMRPMNNIFIGKLVTGIAFFYSMVWMPSFFQILFLLISGSILFPLFKEYWAKQIRSVKITSLDLEIQRGANHERVETRLRHIKSITLIRNPHKPPRRQRRYLNEQINLLIEQNRAEAQSKGLPPQPIGTGLDSEAKLVICDGSYRDVEIESRFFQEGDFEEFTEKLLKAWKQALVSDLGYLATFEEFGATHIPAPAFKTQKAQADSKKTKEQPKNGTIEAIEQQIANNTAQIDKEKDLKKSIEDKLQEAYKTLYYQRRNPDLERMANPIVLFEIKDRNDQSLYFLEDDFFADLSHENIEMGKRVISACHENLRLVQKRIETLGRINKKLKVLRFQEKTNLRLRYLAKELSDIQELNTKESLENEVYGEISEEELDAKIRANLRKTTHIEPKEDAPMDLDSITALDEYIKFFTALDSEYDKKNEPLSPLNPPLNPKGDADKNAE
ncbi:hypothetical protein [Hugenholtzia roseola]|uniref:hypothetical protein n=1 Tax=Hugenholtzia roseola TaxID=1002 RepID=UPI00047EDB9A|nr:hypothetical protein [Hugenholtzia roseola]